MTHRCLLFVALSGLLSVAAIQMPPPDETMPQDGRVSEGPHSATSWVNMIGVPAVVVPAGFYASGLPFGLEFSSRPWTDGNLLGIAYAWEQTTRLRKPPKLVEQGLLSVTPARPPQVSRARCADRSLRGTQFLDKPKGETNIQLMLILGLLLILLTAAQAPHVHQGRRADPAAVVPELPSPGRHRADVAADLRGRAALGAPIKQKVANREMPPWYIDRHVGITEFKDDPSLTDEEIATITTWVDAGAPMGNPADMPPPRQFSDSTNGTSASRTSSSRCRSRTSCPRRAPMNSSTSWSIPGSRKTCTSWPSRRKPRARAFKVAHHFTTNLIEDPKKIRPACSSTSTRWGRTATSSRATRAA